MTPKRHRTMDTQPSPDRCPLVAAIAHASTSACVQPNFIATPKPWPTPATPNPSSAYTSIPDLVLERLGGLALLPPSPPSSSRSGGHWRGVVWCEIHVAICWRRGELRTRVGFGVSFSSTLTCRAASSPAPLRRSTSGDIMGGLRGVTKQVQEAQQQHQARHLRHGKR